jgi:hypothetical protein
MSLNVGMPVAGCRPDTGRKRLRTILLYWCPLILYAGVVFYLSSLSRPQDLLPVAVWDKAAHALEYAILGILGYRALAESSALGHSSHTVLVTILAAALYGVTDEVHQNFVALREPNILDVFADAIGASLGTIAWRRIRIE